MEQPLDTISLADLPFGESGALYLSASVDGSVILAQSYTIVNG